MIHKTAYQESVALLHRAATPDGFVAAIGDTANYRRIWSRDGAITVLAALLTGDEVLFSTARHTIAQLFRHQHPAGFIPSNVTPGTLAHSYGGVTGRTDNIPWAVIGLMLYTRLSGDDSLAVQYETGVHRCFALLDAWEYNARGLLYVPQSGDWADEYIHHGYILYDQLLRLWALELAATYYHSEQYAAKSIQLRQLIAQNYWKHDSSSFYYTKALARMIKKVPEQHWLMGFNPTRVYQQYDLAANALALLLRTGSDDQQKTALGHLENRLAAQKQMLPCYSPVILPGTADMNELADNYAYSFRNHPHEFHNGGLWPVWNGFAAAALAIQGARQPAEQLTSCIHQANQQDDHNGAWGFFEFLHGATYTPMGTKHCTWSAAGAVIAEHAINGNHLI